MKYLICYDISDDKCRRRVVKYLESLAYRIQYSVFRANCTREQLDKIKNRLISISEGYDDVIITIIPICASCEAGTWQYGQPLEERQHCIII